MLFHASIPAVEPQRVARTLAQLWRGHAFEFPPFPGAYIVLADDDRGTEIEVVPHTQENVIGEFDVAARDNSTASAYSAVHLAIATPLTTDEVLRLAADVGWTARICNRGDCFHVIEFWLEDRFLVEVLTDVMQREYQSFMTPQGWISTFGSATALSTDFSPAMAGARAA